MDTMSTKKYGRRLSVKSWRVQENPTTLTIVSVKAPQFLAAVLGCFRASLLARAIACEGKVRDKGPLGSGRPFLGFK